MQLPYSYCAIWCSNITQQLRHRRGLCYTGYLAKLKILARHLIRHRNCFPAVSLEEGLTEKEGSQMPLILAKSLTAEKIQKARWLASSDINCLCTLTLFYAHRETSYRCLKNYDKQDNSGCNELPFGYRSVVGQLKYMEWKLRKGYSPTWPIQRQCSK